MTGQKFVKPTARREWGWIVAALVALLATPVSIAGAAITLPRIAATLGTNPAGLQGVVDAFNFAFATATLACGPLADRLGRRRVLLGGMLLVVIGSLGAASAVSLLTLDLARLVAGAGCAAVFVGTTSLLSATLNGADRARAFTALGVVLGAGLAFGPALCGLLVTVGGWRAVFVTIAVVTAASGVASMLLKTPDEVTSVGAKRDGLLVVLRNRRFLGFALIPVAGAFGYVALLTYLPVALSAVKNIAADQAGVIMLPMTVPTVLAPVIAPRLAKAFGGPARLMLAATALLATGTLLLLPALTPTAPEGALIPGMLLLGCGFGLPMGMVDREAIGSVPDDQSGTAAGAMNFLRLGSEAVVIAGFGAGIAQVIAANLHDTALAARVAAGGYLRPQAYADAFELLSAVMALCTVAVLLMSMRLLRRRPTRRLQKPLPAADDDSSNAAALTRSHASHT
ncbi:MFS transporter [Catenulispora rubra]|uniref:MFS transporter n=1 Tax=Catenulispora rubra TaxID=280293 RepID=UPI0018922F61|nr:MFS transporter [Catenulispora rubra]